MEKLSSPKNKREADARNEIMAIRDQVAAMGANDTEMYRIAEILARLEQGQCSQKEALRLAYEIRDGKNSYH